MQIDGRRFYVIAVSSIADLIVKAFLTALPFGYVGYVAVEYSRGIAEVIYKELGESDIVGTYLDFVTKYVLWDDVLDWERDLKDYGKKKEEGKRQRRLI